MTSDHDQGDVAADDLEYVEEEEKKDVNMVLFPNMLSAMQSQRNAEQLALLPPIAKRRIKALKKSQFELTELEAKFFKEVHELECKYHKLHIPLYEKRSTIVNGEYEPTDEEATWPSDDEEELSAELQLKIKLQEKETPVDVKGIPDFWLTIFRNVSTLSEMVQPHDEEILKHLKDIKLTCVLEPMSFSLHFHFAPNDFFTNTVLTKEYFMKCSADPEDPFNFEGPEIYKCTGCTINWNKGKNITLKTVKKKQKHKSRGVVRTITKTEQNDSFFNFFSPPTIPEGTKEEDVDEETRNLLTSDFEIGHYIRERIIPRAVLYFTGEGVEDEDDDFEEEEEEEDEDEEEEEADSDCKDDKVKPESCKQQ